jgi:hypothetical protein
VRRAIVQDATIAFLGFPETPGLMGDHGIAQPVVAKGHALFRESTHESIRREASHRQDYGTEQRATLRHSHRCNGGEYRHHLQRNSERCEESAKQI